MSTPSKHQPQQSAALSSSWYSEAMEKLIHVVQDLSHSRDVDAITEIVRRASRELTGADGATFVLRDGDQCYYADENAIEPLWKGKRFPMSACVSGWVMRNAQPAIIEDIYNDARVPVEAYRPTFVQSMAMVPIRQNSPIGAIGNYWSSRHVPTQEEISILQALANTTSVALENAELYRKLQNQVYTLQAQQVRISEQHDRLETFTRALSHDLKEPVRAMTSFSRMIQEDHKDPGKFEYYLKHIQNAADRMGMLIDAVFQYTQLDNPEQKNKEICSVQDILNGVKENLSQLVKEQSASIISNGKLPVIEAHSAHMLHVLQNLIANAIRHNQNKVTVQIDVKDQDDNWLFSVHDNGVGIAPEHMEKIFLPFTRLTHKSGHAGLGLAICTKIVTSYGGKIWCESSPGKGSTFFFTIPNTAANAVSEPQSQVTDKQQLATVLLVDDMESDVELMLFAFQRAKIKCNILLARDGKEALEILKKNIDGEKIDLVLLDVNMPCMDGFELLDHIRKNDALKNTKVVMCTGSDYSGDRRRAKELGALGYIVKPPSVDQFSNIIKQIPELHINSDGGSKTIYAS